VAGAIAGRSYRLLELGDARLTQWFLGISHRCLNNESDLRDGSDVHVAGLEGRCGLWRYLAEERR